MHTPSRPRACTTAFDARSMQLGKNISRDEDVSTLHTNCTVCSSKVIWSWCLRSAASSQNSPFFAAAGAAPSLSPPWQRSLGARSTLSAPKLKMQAPWLHEARYQSTDSPRGVLHCYVVFVLTFSRPLFLEMFVEAALCTV